MYPGKESELTKTWFVVKTNHMAEKKVNERLQKLGLETYLPLVKTIRIWSDRKKKLEVPLIPSHLFVCTEEAELAKIYTASGVAGILKEFGRPAIVRAKEIENLRILTQNEKIPEQDSLFTLHEGDEVEVVSGSFSGLIGKSSREQSGYRVFITVPSLGMGWTVVVSQNSVKKL